MRRGGLTEKQNIQTVHQRLDVFKLRILARPTPTIDLITLKEVFVSMCEDVYSILEMRGHEPETAPIELAEDIMLATLFTPPNAPLLYQCERTKRNRSKVPQRERMPVRGRMS